MSYRIAGIDVHKRLLAVVIADVAVEGEYQFARRRVGTNPSDLRALAEWLVAQEVEEVVMESTAQYWRPVWDALERDWQPRRRRRAGAGPLSGTLHLAQAQSNRGPRGRKRDFPDAERLVKRLVAQELTLSFVVLTERNRPVAAVVPLKGIDRETLALSSHPEFLELIARSRAEFRRGHTLTLEEMKGAFSADRSPNKRLQPPGAPRGIRRNRKAVRRRARG
jgi:hypothetical protein